MTLARIQPCLGKLGIDLEYYNRDSALYLYINHFCLKWKSQNVSFNQAIIELKNNFKIFDNHIIDENVQSHFKYEFIPKKLNLI